MVTRLRLATEAGRLAVGYDPDLITDYVELASPDRVDQDDPDEGFVTVRGRSPSDVPDLAALNADMK